MPFFNSITVISGRWEVDNERLFAMELCLRLRRFCHEWDRTRSDRSVGQRLTHWATRAPNCSKKAPKKPVMTLFAKLNFYLASVSTFIFLLIITITILIKIKAPSLFFWNSLYINIANFKAALENNKKTFRQSHKITQNFWSSYIIFRIQRVEHHMRWLTKNCLLICMQIQLPY